LKANPAVKDPKVSSDNILNSFKVIKARRFYL